MDWIAKYWIEAAFGLAIGILGAGYRKLSNRLKEARGVEALAIQKQKEENRATKNGLQALLRDRIIQSYNRYVHDEGCCPIYALENIQAMYRAYHDLGGNGAVDKLVEDIESLPTEKRRGG